MIPLVRLIGLTRRYAAFVIVTNWVSVFGATILAIPGLLLLIGWETPALVCLFSVAFGIIVLRLQWFATKVTLGVSGDIAAAIVVLGLVLDLMTGTAMRGLL
jgi:hypothetical protein